LDGENTVASSRTITVELTQQESQSLLKDVPRAYNTEINDALLTALVQALETWTGEPAHLLDLEGHGREDIFQELDVSRTVGWFTSLYPVRLESGRTGRPEDDLKAVKETLRRVPGRGLGHGVLRYLGTEPVLTRALAERPAAQLLFNYLGQTDQTLPKDSLFSVIPGSVGRPHAPRQRRKYLLNVTGIVAGGHLRMDFTFSEQVHRPETIRTLADRFLYCLRTLITHCLSCEGGFTPSDFPDVELGQAELDSLLNELKAL
ncbi:MAG: condensation domain-containing protein, partial [Archangium sp.]